MKKRLLSAALTLAMVLTMLPLTVFAADPTPGDTDVDGGKATKLVYEGTSVSYYKKDAQLLAKSGDKEAVKAAADGYYHVGTISGVTDSTARSVYYVGDGVITGSGTSGGTWYSTVENALGPSGEKITIGTGNNTEVSKGNASAIRLMENITSDADLTKANQSTVTIDTCGHELTLNNGQGSELKQGQDPATNNSKLTKLVITSTAKNAAGETVKGKVSGSLFAIKQNLTVEMTDIEKNSTALAIKLSNDATNSNKLTVTLTRAEAGTIETSFVASAITLKDKSTAGVVTLNGTTTGKTEEYTQNLTTSGTSEVGAVTVTGKGSKVSLTDTNTTSTADVKASGINTVVEVYGNSTVGDIEIFGSAKVDDKVPSGNGPKVTLGVGTNVKGVKTKASSNECMSATVSATGSTIGTTGIQLDLGSATVSGGSVDTDGIKVKTGTVEIKDGASVATVELAETGNTKLTVTSTGSVPTTVNSVGKANGGTGSVTLDIKGGVFGTTFGAGDDYKGHGVSGGTFGKQLGRDYLATTLAYEIAKTEGSSTTYTYTSNFQDLVDAYKESSTNNKPAVIGSKTGDKSIEFSVDGKVVLSLTVPEGEAITLPTSIDGASVPLWYRDGNPQGLSGSFTMPSGLTSSLVLSATSTSDVSNIVSVSADNGIKAELVGTTIKLSGVAAYGSFIVRIFTEDNPDKGQAGDGYEATVAFAHNYISGKDVVSFTNVPLNASISGGDSINMVFNGKTYTLDGSGLRTPVANVEIEGISLGTGTETGKVQVGSISFTGKTPGTEKAWKDALEDSTNSQVTFNGSNAVKNAVSLVVAGISEQNMKDYILRAQNAQARKDHPSGTIDDTMRQATGYNKVIVEAYLEVSVSSWTSTGSSLADAITMNLTPKYKVYVTATSGTGVSNPYSITSGSLNLTGDYGEVDVALVLPTIATMGTSTAQAPAVWAHHKNTAANVYPVVVNDTNKTIEFTTTDGFSPFEINGIAAAVTRESGSDTFYYDSLQTAVDETENGDTLTLGDNYKGATSVSVTGKARTFRVARGNGNGSVALTFNGAKTTVDTATATAGQWIVQLERDNFTNAGISVNTSGNGTASVNVSTAKPGSTVSGTYTANSGYKAGTFTATAQPGNKSVTVSVSANGTFSFTVPSDATSVTVTPSFVLDTGLPFTDVYATDWYFDGVKYCYNTTNNGYRLMTGLSDTKFGSDRPYERAQVVQILWNMKGRPEPKTTVNPYTDISSIHYAYKAVLWATENNYAEGYPDGTFRPGQSVTREEMVVFLWRAAGKPAGYNSISLNGYTDGYNVHDWGLSAVKWAVALNILSGQNSVSLNGTLAARSTAYRREVAVTVMQFDQKNLF